MLDEWEELSNITNTIYDKGIKSWCYECSPTYFSMNEVFCAKVSWAACHKKLQLPDFKNCKLGSTVYGSCPLIHVRQQIS